MGALAKWVGAKVSKDEAKDRLAELPVSSTKHGDKVPFPFADKSAYKSKHSNREINRAIEKAPLVDVPLDKLYAIQHSVKSPHVEGYIEEPDALPKGSTHPRAGTPTDHPVVIKQDGKLYIHDGHHRATAALLRGKKTITSRLVDFDQ